MKPFTSIIVFAILLTSAHGVQAQVTFNSVPSRIVGQAVLQQQTLTAVAPNLVEGRELNNPEAVAVDTSATPPIVYVADTNNNRVLAWRNPAALGKGDRAEKVIGQRDFIATAAKGPGSDLVATGLNSPLALAVDKSGNLYVVDGGNNRILRYPAPFNQTSDLLAQDLIIGQASINGRASNEGLSAPTEKTLSFSNGSVISRAGLAFDQQGNLWVSDPLNNRVLRYPASALVSGQNEPAADVVLGQNDFVSRNLPASPTRDGKNFLAAPSGLAFDPQGRLFVADNQNRVVVYTSLVSGALAARLLGIILPTAQVPSPPTLNETTLGSAGGPPEGVFFVGNNPFVVDRGNARILKYDPFDQWPAESTAFSPKAIAVIGQPNFVSNRSNQGLAQPSAQTFSGPIQAHNAFEASGVISAVAAGNDLYVADAGNNRILIFPQQSGGNFSAANRVLGQVDFQYNSVNLIEGREFFLQAGGSVLIDTQSNPPHLYVSDPPNNRVLGFKDYRTVKAGDRADLVIGQPDFFTAVTNYPKNDPNQMNDQGLSFPQGLALDATENLWVADFGNARALRFPRPFDQPQASALRANLVIGQQNFFSKVTDASSQTMSGPYGIVITNEGHLLVSDNRLNRVLLFLKPSGGDLINGQAAARVVGQPDFGPHSGGSLSNPSLIAVDSDDRLYVADTGNNRIVAYRSVAAGGNDPAPSFSLTSANAGVAISSPLGVFASQSTGDIWVANTGANSVIRFPRFDALVTKSAPNVSISSFGPLSVALDPFGNPVVAESVNRVAFYFPTFDLSTAAGGLPGRFSGNAANYFQRFAPGMLASIFSLTSTHFGDDTQGFTAAPAPHMLGDVNVFVAGIPAPLLYASPGQINFQVPYGTPVGSGFQEIQVVRASTGQIVASALVRIDPVSPGLFTADSSGNGPLAALNEDNVKNDALHPAKGGSIIQLFGTGVGVVSGAPPDGVPAPLVQLPTDEKPRVYINATTGPIPDQDVLYSGLAPGFIGLWQINARIPKNVPIGDVDVAVVFKDINTRLDQNGNQRRTTIRTTP